MNEHKLSQRALEYIQSLREQSEHADVTNNKIVRRIEGKKTASKKIKEQETAKSPEQLAWEQRIGELKEQGLLTDGLLTRAQGVLGLPVDQWNIIRSTCGNEVAPEPLVSGVQKQQTALGQLETFIQHYGQDTHQRKYAWVFKRILQAGIEQNNAEELVFMGVPLDDDAVVVSLWDSTERGRFLNDEEAYHTILREMPARERMFKPYKIYGKSDEKGLAEDIISFGRINSDEDINPPPKALMRRDILTILRRIWDKDREFFGQVFPNLDMEKVHEVITLKSAEMGCGMRFVQGAYLPQQEGPSQKATVELNCAVADDIIAENARQHSRNVLGQEMEKRNREEMFGKALHDLSMCNHEIATLQNILKKFSGNLILHAMAFIHPESRASILQSKKALRDKQKVKSDLQSTIQKDFADLLRAQLGDAHPSLSQIDKLAEWHSKKS